MKSKNLGKPSLDILSKNMKIYQNANQAQYQDDDAAYYDTPQFDINTNNSNFQYLMTNQNENDLSIPTQNMISRKPTLNSNL